MISQIEKQSLNFYVFVLQYPTKAMLEVKSDALIENQQTKENKTKPMP
jgi:hypothetical protein